MKSYMVYESEDGKLFGTMEECLAHEHYRNHLPPSIRWYGEGGQRIEPTFYKEIDSCYNNVVVFEILDIEGWQKDLQYMIEEFGYGERKFTPGRYYYVGNMEYNDLMDWCWAHPERKIYGWDEWIKLEEGESDPYA